MQLKIKNTGDMVMKENPDRKNSLGVYWSPPNRIIHQVECKFIIKENIDPS